ncbi:MAG TPA: TRAP transporter small permease subunit, partial [Xanthomonadales bacterium]|nr:TRAP transporter small permease subunit [Xanthomonadales bacterium]
MVINVLRPRGAVLARVQRIALGIAGAALVGVAAVQAWQVFARYVLNDSPGWTEPVALLLLATAMSLAAGAAVRSRSHFGFYVLVESARPRVARVLRALSDVAIAAVGVAIA